MNDGREKIEKTLEEFIDSLLLRTILTNLSDVDVGVFLDLLLSDEFGKAESLLVEKIPDLDKKVGREAKKSSKRILNKLDNV